MCASEPAFGGGVLQSEMESECLVEIGEENCAELAAACTETVDRDGADLFGSGFRVSLQTGDCGREQYLERIEAGDVRRDGDNGEDAASESSGGCVGAVIADDHRWSSFVGFGTTHGVEVDEADLAASHQPSPSARAESQASDSSLVSQSDHAAS